MGEDSSGNVPGRGNGRRNYFTYDQETTPPKMKLYKYEWHDQAGHHRQFVASRMAAKKAVAKIRANPDPNNPLDRAQDFPIDTVCLAGSIIGPGMQTKAKLYETLHPPPNQRTRRPRRPGLRSCVKVVEEQLPIFVRTVHDRRNVCES